MGEYKLVVLTKPTAGREDEFNDWYTNKHLDDVLKIPGFTAAQRFKIVGDPVNTEKRWDYFAVYEVDSDEPQVVLDELSGRFGTELMPSSEAMDMDLYCVLYEEITPRKVK